MVLRTSVIVFRASMTKKTFDDEVKLYVMEKNLRYIGIFSTDFEVQSTDTEAQNIDIEVSKY